MTINMLFLYVTISALLRAAEAYPSGYAWGCMSISADLPFCDPTLSVTDRVEDLVSRLTLDGKDIHCLSSELYTPETLSNLTEYQYKNNILHFYPLSSYYTCYLCCFIIKCFNYSVEKFSFLGADTTNMTHSVNSCDCMTRGIPRLGIL